MKIRAITPILVDADELARRQERYDKLSPENIQIVLENLPDHPASPNQLGNAHDLASSEELTLSLGLTTDNSFDAIMPDCVLDPSVADLDQRAPVPAHGITRLSAGVLAGLGTSFGVITRNDVIGEEYARVINRYGLAAHFSGVYTLGLSVEDISDTEQWNKAVRNVAEQAGKDGVTVLVNGCSAVEVTYSDLGVTIVDPTALALKFLAFSADQGLI